MKLNQRLLELALPMVLANVSVALLGMVDTAVVGHLPDARFLGGVALATIIFDFLFWGFGFLRMSTTGVVAQRYGKQDYQAVRDRLLQSFALAFALALLVLAVSGPLLQTVLPRLEGSAAVKLEAARYYEVKIWGAIPLFLQYVLIGAFIGMQNTRIPLVMALLLNLINVSLDFIFVFGFGLGVVGVALGSLIAEMLTTCLGMLLLLRLMRGLPGVWQMRVVLDARALGGQMGLNLTILLRTLCLIFTFAFFTNAGARLGDNVLAANAVLFNCLLLMALGLDGFAQAVEALVGRFYGVNDRDSLQRVVGLGMRWSVGFACVFVLFFWMLGPTIVHLMVDLPEVETLALRYLPWLIFAPLVGVWPFFYDGVFVGATRGRDMMWSMLVATFCVFLPAWYFTRGWGNHGLWFAMLGFLSARGALLAGVWHHLMRHQKYRQKYPSA